MTDRIIVFFKNEKYDITDFVNSHPGGRQVLIKCNGRDIEKHMNKADHSEYAYSLLEKYKVK